MSYKLIIDPLTRGIRLGVTALIEPGAKVLDIACGTGALAFELAGKAGQVTGIDLNSAKIRYANGQALKRRLQHVRFLEADATHLESLFPEPFDFTVLSLAVHQFPEPLRTEILHQAMRISRCLILADYTVPRPKSPAGHLALLMEKIAGGEHYAAYKTYLAAGGLRGIAQQSGLKIGRSVVVGSGVFTILKLSAL